MAQEGAGLRGWHTLTSCLTPGQVSELGAGGAAASGRGISSATAAEPSAPITSAGLLLALLCWHLFPQT